MFFWFSTTRLYKGADTETLGFAASALQEYLTILFQKAEQSSGRGGTKGGIFTKLVAHTGIVGLSIYADVDCKHFFTSLAISAHVVKKSILAIPVVINRAVAALVSVIANPVTGLIVTVKLQVWSADLCVD